LQAEAESTADRISEVVQSPRPVTGFVEAGEAWATEAAGQHEALREVSAALAEETAASVRRAREALDQARSLADRQRRHSEALRRAALLAERRPERDRLAVRLDLAARADRVVPLIRSATDRARRCERAARRVELARQTVAELVPGEAPEDVLRKAERERLDQAAGLTRLAGDARRLAELREEIAGDRRRLDAFAAEREQIAEALDVLPGRVEELRAELDEVRVRTAMREGAVTLAEEAARRLDDARLRDRLTGELAAARDEHRVAVDAAQAARDRWLDLRRVRLDGMAATLAGDLRDGEPCMVCGSLDHPAPASALGPIPGEAEEKRAEAAAEKAQRARERTAGTVAELTARLEGARERAGDRTAEALALELRAADAELNDIDAVATRVEPLTAEIKELEDLLTRARDRHSEVISEESAARARQAEAGAEVERLTARLDEARGEDPTLEARRQRLIGEAGALKAAADAVRDADLAEDELAAARKEASAAAEAESFPSLDEAGKAALPEAERAALTERLRAFDDEQASVGELLSDPELVQAAALPAPDLSAAESALADAEAVHSAASHALDRATHRRDRLAALRTTLARQIAAWRPAAERHATAARMAGIAGGDPSHNTLRTRLSAYVLGHRLTQVVAAANERLHRMSDGRYALRHTVDRTAGESRRHGTGGLGLRVTDAWTGQERDPATLSGGESFISSLALALGLADVVTSEAGGTEIGTLFVDEGFGTLDDQTLDEVMEVLDGLRDGGRAVGIVSHVAELRSRIPAQLHVSKSRTGSHTRVAA
jgi:exonuclease SbcC